MIIIDYIVKYFYRILDFYNFIKNLYNKLKKSEFLPCLFDVFECWQIQNLHYNFKLNFIRFSFFG